MEKQEFEKRGLKKGGLKNEIYYFWMNNRLLILAFGIIAALGIGFAVFNLVKKETVINVILMDCHTDHSPEQMEKDFLKAENLDPGSCHAEIVTNLMLNSAGSSDYAMVSLSRLLSDIGSEKLDVCGLTEEDFHTYNETDAFLDLRDYFSQEQLRKFDGYLYTEEDGSVRGIYAEALPVLKEYECYMDPSAKAVLGIIYNSRRKEQAVRYLLYLAGN